MLVPRTFSWLLLSTGCTHAPFSADVHLRSQRCSCVSSARLPHHWIIFSFLLYTGWPSVQNRVTVVPDSMSFSLSLCAHSVDDLSFFSVVVPPPCIHSRYRAHKPRSSRFICRHTSARPLRQLRQRPQATLKGTETMSPGLRNSASEPISTTSPVISCPMTIPSGTGNEPR